MDISPDGQWLFALDGNGVTIDQYQINSTTGLLSSAAGASYKITGATVVPRAVKVSPNGDYVFVALGTAGDLVYSFSTTTGLLTSSQQLAPVSTTTSDNALAVSPTSSTLYIARSGTSGGLAAYSIGNNGALTSVSGSPFAAGTQPYSVVVNNAGTDVYVANRGDGTISGYGVASSGTLTALTGSPYTSGPAVTALAADKTGDYLLAAANGGAPDLTLYSFDSVVSGKLDLTTTAATGTDPTGPVAIALTH
jgi:6-phosphogluconolactonase (cycloisomerase 2 family)